MAGTVWRFARREPSVAEEAASVARWPGIADPFERRRYDEMALRDARQSKVVVVGSNASGEDLARAVASLEAGLALLNDGSTGHVVAFAGEWSGPGCHGRAARSRLVGGPWDALRVALRLAERADDPLGVDLEAGGRLLELCAMFDDAGSTFEAAVREGLALTMLRADATTEAERRDERERSCRRR